MSFCGLNCRFPQASHTSEKSTGEAILCLSHLLEVSSSPQLLAASLFQLPWWPLPLPLLCFNLGRTHEKCWDNVPTSTSFPAWQSLFCHIRNIDGF